MRRRLTHGSNPVHAIIMALGMCLLVAGVAHAVELRTVDGESIECDWIGASDQAITVTPTDADGAPREIALADLDRLTLASVRTTESKAEPAGPFIDNDGPHSVQRREGKIKLRAGLHRFVVPFVQGTGGAVLQVNVTLSDKWSKNLEPAMLFHVPDGKPEPVSPGLDDEGYRLPENPPQVEPQLRYVYRTYNQRSGSDWPNYVRQLPELEPAGEGLTPQLSAGVADRAQGYGILFTGYVKIDEDGEYVFRLSSDDGSQWYFGRTPDFLLTDPVVKTVAAGDWRVELADGGEVVGAIEAWDATGLAVSMAIGDESVSLTIPVSRVEKVARVVSNDDAPGVDTSDAPNDADTVYVTNDDGPAQRVSGVVLGVEGDALLFRFEEQDRRIKLEKIVEIALAGAADESQTLDFHQVLGLSGGQSVAGKLVGASDGRVRFDMAWGQRIDVPMDRVTSVRTRNGRLVYLSDMTPTAVEQTPYFDRVIPYRNDTSLAGEAIKLFGDDKVYDRGVSTHSRSVLSYALGGQFAGFKSTVGLLDPLGARGNVSLRVLGDGRVLFERESYTAGEGPIPLDLDVAAVNELSIETGFGAGQDVGDRVGWAEARLLRSADHP